VPGQDEDLGVYAPAFGALAPCTDPPLSGGYRLFLTSLQAQADEIVKLATATSNALAKAIASDRSSGAIAEIAHRTIPRWHFAMLNDRERNDAFAMALQRHVRPGCHVLDIGTGTGLLAMMAIRAGAGRVTTCEVNPLMAEIARQIIHDHGMSECITVIPKQSTSLRIGHDLATPADMIISEIVDCGLIGEGLFPTMRHARHSLLAPRGLILPKSARLWGFLIESNIIMGLNHVTNAGGLDVRRLNAVATHGHFPVRLPMWPYRALSNPVELARFDFTRDSLMDDCRIISLPVTACGRAQALALWFEMDLGDGVILRNAPENTQSHWVQALVPFSCPQLVLASGTATVELQWQDERLSARPVSYSGGATPTRSGREYAAGMPNQNTVVRN
jgi:SAM-dependent methyltransferase